MSHDLFLFLTTFLASGVEAVEALTIVLALGVVRGWRAPLIGVGIAALVLGVIIAVLGPALRLLPIDTLRLFVGALLLIFGLQWLRKAILRASGYKALHDEAAAFDAEREQASHDEARRAGGDGLVLIHGRFQGRAARRARGRVHRPHLRSDRGQDPLAAAAAVVATALVVVVGIAVRAPLERVPENTIKFAVGLLLTSFGVFWGGEGAGVSWPGSDLAILAILAFLALLSFALVRQLRRQRLAGLPAGASA